MKKIFFTLTLIVSYNSFATSQNLFQMFKTPVRLIDKTQYPQNYKKLHSGSFKKRMSTGQAVNAMLGSKNIYFQSKTFNNIVSCLMKKKDICSKDIVKYWDPLLLAKETYRRNFLLKQIGLKRRENQGRFTNHTLAQQAAVKIIETYFSWLGTSEIRKNFVKYKYTIKNKKTYSANIQDIPWPSEIVYSSLQSYTAALYGPRTIIFKENEKRSLDVGYWNFLNSGYWYGTARDMGEFITPGYIPGKDIIGYQIRLKLGGTFKPSKTGFGKRWSPEYHQIEYAFYKDKVDGVPVVLVFAGDLNSCIEKIATLEYRYCEDPIFDIVKPGKINEDKYQKNQVKLNQILSKIKRDPNRYPRIITYKKAKLIGVYTLSGQSSLPSKILNYYPKIITTKKEARWFQKKVNKENLLSIKFHPAQLER